ncbi:MAG: 16S rRNA (guanine(966)-N(2))-methyltransferase RsmD [Nitrospirae bacterium]|nr:16S rRNA (guanine(966)-N(2))-methyltransferase RsmD [Nitrospirota bacterium]
MRIIGGNAKGRAVGSKKAFSKSPGGHDLRPTPAKVRKAIFDILGQRIDGARMLDLYSGTGAVGIEALSRGASYVAFVEEDDKRAALISKYITSFNLEQNSAVICSKSARFLSTSIRLSRSVGFDIIFMDPPYDLQEWETVMELICAKGLLAENAVVIAEHSSKKEMPEQKLCLKLKKRYKYGDTSLSLYIKTNSMEE